jgi:hypothetical protein
MDNIVSRGVNNKKKKKKKKKNICRGWKIFIFYISLSSLFRQMAVMKLKTFLSVGSNNRTA